MVFNFVGFHVQVKHTPIARSLESLFTLLHKLCSWHIASDRMHQLPVAIDEQACRIRPDIVLRRNSRASFFRVGFVIDEVAVVLLSYGFVREHVPIKQFAGPAPVGIHIDKNELPLGFGLGQ
jgi:hypothetical protein